MLNLIAKNYFTLKNFVYLYLYVRTCKEVLPDVWHSESSIVDVS